MTGTAKNAQPEIVNRQSEMPSWLPSMDLNHDKQIQSLLCYRYTTRQFNRDRKLRNLR